MDASTTFQNQNTNMTKTFIAAFAGVALAIPIVIVLTTAIVKAQIGSLGQQLAHALPANTEQVNSLVGPSCQAPADDSAEAADGEVGTSQANHASSPWGWSWKGGNVNQSQSNSSVTNTTNNVDKSRTYNRTTTIEDSFNLGSNNGNFSNNNSGNTVNSGNVVGNNVNSGNAIGNTVDSYDDNVIGSNNPVLVNSGNQDNDVVDVL